MNGPTILRILKSTGLCFALTLTGCYQTPEATVNGEEVTRKDLESALRLAGGQRMLQKLIMQRLIAQEAARAGITLTTAELKAPLQAAHNTVTDPELLPLLEQEIRTRLLLRKLVLRDVTEAKLKDYYELFRDDLMRRETYSMLVRSHSEAEQARRELNKGTEFRLAAATHAMYKADRQRGGYRGPLTRTEIYQTFGLDNGDRVLDLKPGEITEPINVNGEFLLVQVSDVHDSFLELRPTLEELAGQAQMAPLMYRLLVTAKIDGPSIRDPKRLPQTSIYGREMLMPWELRAQATGTGPVSPESVIETAAPVNATAPAAQPSATP